MRKQHLTQLFYSFLVLGILFGFSNSNAQPDTTKVRIFEFNGGAKSRTSWVDFPVEGNSYEKVLMNYTVKCPEGKACGEWDYLTYVFLDHYYTPTFRVNGETPATFDYSNSLTKSDYEVVNFVKNITETKREGTKNKLKKDISFVNTEDGTMEIVNDNPGYVRSQFYFTTEELTEAGLYTDEITAIQLKVDNNGAVLKDFSVALKFAKNTETSDVYVPGTKVVYHRDQITIDSDIMRFEFPTELEWTQGLDLVLEISYESDENNKLVVKSETTTNNQIIAETSDDMLVFDGSVRAETMSRYLGNEANELTIAFWVFVDKVDARDGLITMDGPANFTGLFFGHEVAIDDNTKEWYPQFRIHNKSTINMTEQLPMNQWVHVAAVWKSGEYSKLYVNGELKGENTSDVYDGNLNISRRWRIGRDRGNNGRILDGMMGEIHFFNKALDDTEIANYKDNPNLEDTDANKANLLAQYNFNQNMGFMSAFDKSGNKNNALLFGNKTNEYGHLTTKKVATTVKTVQSRPVVLFEEGSYEFDVVEEFVEMKTLDNAQYEVVYYNENETTVKSVDYLYPVGRTITRNGDERTIGEFNNDGQLVLEQNRVDFKDDFTIRDRFEIMRYITPYGNGLDLGEGWTYIMDMTDFVMLFEGPCFIDAPDGPSWSEKMEDLELTMDFIKGTPVREVKHIQKLWSKNVGYEKTFNDQFKHINYEMKDGEESARVKVCITGHGMNDSEGCAEFCERNLYIKVDDDTLYTQPIWTDSCAHNPIHPQGGTWTLSRSIWCPGMDVKFLDFDVTESMKNNPEMGVDMDVEYIDVPNNGQRNYIVESFLVVYGAYAYQNEAEVINIISPNNDQRFLRYNPNAGKPIIEIRNNGEQPLTSLTFNYGVEGFGSAEHTWTGELKFGETSQIALPMFDWGFSDKEIHKFYVDISMPNGQEDENQNNDHGECFFEHIFGQYPTGTQVHLLTNKYAAYQYNFTVTNLNTGEVVAKRDLGLNDNTDYYDDMELGDGVYEFVMRNELGHGTSHWFMIRQGWGAGRIEFMYKGKVVTDFNQDFGREFRHQFVVGNLPEATYSRIVAEYDTVQINQEKDIEIKIAPLNEAGLKIKDIDMRLSKNKGFSLVSTEPELLPGKEVALLTPQDTFKMVIRFAPTKHKAVNTSIEVHTNDAVNPIQEIELVAFGQDPNGIEETINNTLALEISQNPVQNSAIVKFATGENNKNTKLALYNTLGEEVLVLFNEYADPNYNEVEFNTNKLSSGTYYLVLTTNGMSKSIPVVIAK